MSSARFANKSFSWRVLSLGLACALGAGFASTPAWADDVTDVQAMLAAGKTAEGLAKVDALLKAKPGDARLRLQRGIALSLLGRNPEAIEVFKKLISTHPEMPGPYNNLAVLYANQGDYEKARAALEQAVKANPGYATAYQNLGDIHARLAEKAYAKSLSLDKTDLALPLKIAAVQNIFEPGAPARPSPPAAAVAKAAAPTPVIAAATAPAPVAAVAKAAAAPPKMDTSAGDAQAVRAALDAWAAAWSKRDMWAYFAAYSPEFKGKAASRKAWEVERVARISSKKEISVVLSDVQVKLEGGTATVTFKQDYRADGLKMQNDKVLTLDKGKTGDWQIRSESTRAPS